MIRHNGIVIDREKKSITHCGATWRPYRSVRGDSQVFRALTMLILGDGVSRAQLFFHIYGGREDGGPLDGPHIFHVLFGQWKPIFAQLHLELRTMRIAGVTFYCLVPNLQAERADVA